MPQPDWSRMATLPLTAWHPRSQLSLPATPVPRSAVPAIDIHNHLGRWLSDGEWMIDDVDALLRVMDERNIQAMVNLDGMWDDELRANLDRYDRAHPGRFLTFCQLDWEQLAEGAGEERLLASLEESAAQGARGVKVWKNLGLRVHDEQGRLVMPDDPRVVRVLGRAGELGLPVLIHTADPKAFFEPVDEKNERLDELLVERDWWFGDTDRFPTFETLLAALRALVLATPGTTYIGAHAGCAAEDLDLVEALIADAPNFTIDIAGRVAELGRQPRRFRRLIEAWPDRVLFGTDIYPITSEQFELHFRFLESTDEAFEYAPGEAVPPQGRWTVSGLGLDAPELAAIYHDNAARVLGL
ncbi:amidohydrolase family protein [Microbacterium sp. STN6]|uniref:amidohydrolase family protein n=1 Tax=Microbacterium sp. STN6 TaxID=2995588 RepID=UPI002260AD17|nr:amidohydrolase family protein [Microbacterium sp. STN6]MCX7523345.1 amidohydrolase family protein [Microbacterium sp. STN6]